MRLQFKLTLNEEGNNCGRCPFQGRMTEMVDGTTFSYCQAFSPYGYPVVLLQKDRYGENRRCRDCLSGRPPSLPGLEWQVSSKDLIELRNKNGKEAKEGYGLPKAAGQW